VKADYDIAVVGGGAAGLMAARSAAITQQRGGRRTSVVLLEGNPKFGKKLLATGNGRCNLSNLELSIGHYHGDRELAAAVIEKFPTQRIIDEFEKMGLLCRADQEGRLYPNNLQAAAVLQALRFSCEEAQVQCVCGFLVSSITKEEKEFVLVSDSGERVRAGRCILASGGMASPRHSCSQNGYTLARELGHSIVKCLPVLVPVKSSSKLLKPLKGMRSKVYAALLADGKKVAGESGEVIFNEGALSGICIFNLSSLVGEWQRTGKLQDKAVKKLEISLDFAENYSWEELLHYLRQIKTRHSSLPGGELFSGLLNLKVGQELAKSFGIDRQRPVAGITDAELKKMTAGIKSQKFEVSGLSSFENAQVTSGGIPLSEVTVQTMESKICSGLYMAGELLHVNGDCGGYNLHWAWATGLCAGSSAAKSGCEGLGERKQC
jgi:predicted Rossmann fold flavoprotein